MAPREGGRRRGRISITNIREGIWILAICVLWYSAHSAHWQLAQQAQKYEYEIRELQRLVTATQDHSKSLLSTHCNVTAIANVLASIAPPVPPPLHTDNTNSHLRTSLHHGGGVVDKIYSLEESAMNQFYHLEDRMFSMGTHSSDPLKPQPLPTTVKPEVVINNVGKIPLPQTMPSTFTSSSALSVVRQSNMGAEQATVEWGRRSRVKKQGDREWLLIGIPTVPRVNNEDHLIRVLSSILEQLPTDQLSDFYGRVKVLVMDASHKTHQRFEEAKARWGEGSGSPHTQHVEFFQEPTVTVDTGGNKGGSANRPGDKVRRQTRNIASVLRHAAYRGSYFLFLEDDMLMCPQAIRAAIYLIDRVTSYHSDWFAVRSSFGMNGIFMQSKDLDTFASYLVQHQARRPPDHLVVEYYAGEITQSAKIKQSRPHFGFRYNLCDHLGKQSTLRVFNVESFKPKECPMDDLWPCPQQPKEPRLKGLPEAVLPPTHPSKHPAKKKRH